MPSPIETLLQEAASTFIHNTCRVGGVVASPFKSALNVTEGVVYGIEAQTEEYSRQSKASLTNKEEFRRLNERYALRHDPNGKLVRYFLSSLEMLPPDRREAMMFRARTCLDSEPELYEKLIADRMRRLMQESLLNPSGQSVLIEG